MGRLLSHEEFLNKLKNKNLFYKNGELEVVGRYKSALCIIEVKTKYGSCMVEANSLVKGYFPTITSAIDKNKYCINMFRAFHGDLYEYPNLVYEGNKKKIKAVCKKHGDFIVTPKEHFKGSRCSKCALELNSFRLEDWKSMNPENDGVLYLLRCFNYEEEFYKIGITSMTIGERYKTPSKMPYKYEILFSFNYFNRDVIWELEKDVKRYIVPYYPKIKFKGSLTECFDENYKKEVLRILKTYENYQIENWKEYETIREFK